MWYIRLVIKEKKKKEKGEKNKEKGEEEKKKKKKTKKRYLDKKCFQDLDCWRDNHDWLTALLIYLLIYLFIYFLILGTKLRCIHWLIIPFLSFLLQSFSLSFLFPSSLLFLFFLFFLFFSSLYLHNTAPWTPKLKSMTDSSHFDSHGIEDHPDDGPIDYGLWDKNFWKNSKKSF